jgi:hypothetical protein
MNSFLYKMNNRNESIGQGGGYRTKKNRYNNEIY